MTTIDKDRQTYPIVVGQDYSPLGDRGLEQACSQAQLHEHSHLHVIHVEDVDVPRSYEDPDETLTSAVAEASQRLYGHVERVVRDWCSAHASPIPFEQLTTHIRAGAPAEAIAQLASDLEAELVVMGTHGRRGARRFLLGSVAEGMLRLAPCAVLVVREPNADVPRIEPPCPRCLEARRASHGKELWCVQHREHHEQRHTYHRPGSRCSHQSGFLIHAD